MFAYRQTFQPAFAAPRMGQATPPAAPPAAPPATTGPASLLTPSQRKGGIAFGIAGTAFGVTAAWMGVRSGIREEGIFSVLGWVVAAGGGAFALLHLVGALGIYHSSGA